jgi:hypothetical protein
MRAEHPYDVFSVARLRGAIMARGEITVIDDRLSFRLYDLIGARVLLAVQDAHIDSWSHDDAGLVAGSQNIVHLGRIVEAVQCDRVNAVGFGRRQSARLSWNLHASVHRPNAVDFVRPYKSEWRAVRELFLIECYDLLLKRLSVSRGLSGGKGYGSDCNRVPTTDFFLQLTQCMESG